jgi:uncharacterized protein DUF2442
MLKEIIAVRAIGDHRLYLRFEDGAEGEIDLRRLVPFEGVFEPLQDLAEVAKVRVDPGLGTICWPNGADLDPDVLYAELTGIPLDLSEAASVRSRIDADAWDRQFEADARAGKLDALAERALQAHAAKKSTKL